MSGSIPFEHKTKLWFFVTNGFMLLSVALIALDGVTIKIISVSFMLSSKSVKHLIEEGTIILGKNLHLCSLFISSASSLLYDHN